MQGHAGVKVRSGGGPRIVYSGASTKVEFMHPYRARLYMLEASGAGTFEMRLPSVTTLQALPMCHRGSPMFHVHNVAGPGNAEIRSFDGVSLLATVAVGAATTIVFVALNDDPERLPADWGVKSDSLVVPPAVTATWFARNSSLSPGPDDYASV